MARLAFMSQLFPDRICSPQAVRGFAELFESGFEILHDFLGDNVGIGKVVGSSAAFISDPEDVEAGFVAIDATNSCLQP